MSSGATKHDGKPLTRPGVGGRSVSLIYDVDWAFLNLLSLIAVFLPFGVGYMFCLSNYFNSYSLGQELSVSVNYWYRWAICQFETLKNYTYTAVLIYTNTCMQTVYCLLLAITYTGKLCSETLPIINTLSYLIINLWGFSCRFGG